MSAVRCVIDLAKGPTGELTGDWVTGSVRQVHYTSYSRHLTADISNPPSRQYMRNFPAFVALSLVLILNLSAQAQWQTVVHTLLGGRPTPADPHPLSYWTRNPILRHRGEHLCMGCPRRGGGVITEQDYTAESKVRDLGTIAGYRILEVDNRVVAKDAAADTPISKYPPEYRRQIDYKILLAQTGADEYREIYHLENDWDALQPLRPAR